MIITTTVKASLDRAPVMETVSVMQDDKYSRNISFQLYTNGTPWTPPSDATALVRYIKPDGTGGSYDTLPDGSTACAFTDNVLTVALAPQVCTVPGVVRLTAAIISGTAELHTFTVQIHVHANPGLQMTSEDYYKISGTLPMPASAQVGQYFRVKAVDAAGKVTEVETVQVKLGDPVAYLYNGLELPGLPEWDKEVYPYAYFMVSALLAPRRSVWLYLHKSIEYKKADNGNWCISLANGFLRATLSSDANGSFDGSQWSTLEENTSNGTVITETDWANFDVLNEDGTVYLAASDPVPVYGAGSLGTGDAGSTAASCGISHVTLTTVLVLQDRVVDLSADEVTAIADVHSRGDALVLTFPIEIGIGGATINTTCWMTCEDYAPVTDEIGAMYVSGPTYSYAKILTTDTPNTPYAEYILAYDPVDNTANLTVLDVLNEMLAAASGSEG